MEYIEAPKMSRTRNGLFIAGGITDCPDWQARLVLMLDQTNCTIFNPRRKDFPIHDPTAAQTQIEWEHEYLHRAVAISFWFPWETLNPIVLYELGAWSMTDKPIFVGVHPEYKRRQDVEIQTKLARPDVEVTYSITDLAVQIYRHFGNVNAPDL